MRSTTLRRASWKRQVEISGRPDVGDFAGVGSATRTSRLKGRPIRPSGRKSQVTMLWYSGTRTRRGAIIARSWTAISRSSAAGGELWLRRARPPITSMLTTIECREEADRALCPYRGSCWMRIRRRRCHRATELDDVADESARCVAGAGRNARQRRAQPSRCIRVTSGR